jgi:hypothetical protein
MVTICRVTDGQKLQLSQFQAKRIIIGCGSVVTLEIPQLYFVSKNMKDDHDDLAGRFF